MSTAKAQLKSDRLKDDVIHIRTTPQDKTLIEKAATILGITTSSFVLENALKAARKEIDEVERLELSRKDAEVFLKALTQAPPPNEALKEAIKSHKKLVKES